MPRHRFTILVALFVTVVINYLDRTNISIAAVDLARDLSLTKIEMGIVFSAFAWTYSLFQIPGGLLADRFRPRLLYPLLLTLWSIATIVQGMAGTLIMLVVCRVLVGVFEAPSYPINNRVVTSWFPERERAGAIAFYTSGQYLGLAFLAPLLVAFQAEFGWRALFYTCGAVGIVWAWIWHILYRDPDQDARLTEPERRAMAAGGALIDWADRHDGGSAAKVAKAPALSGLSVALSSRKLWGVYLGQFCIGTVSIFFLTWFPTYLVESRGIEFAKVGFIASAPFLAAFCGILLSGTLSDWMVRRGVDQGLARKAPVLIGIALSTSMVSAIYADTDLQVMVIMSLAFFGNGLASITWIFISLLAPRNHIGLVGGVFNFIGGLSAVVTPLVIGLLIEGSNFTPALIYMCVVTLIGIFAYTVLVGKIERVAAPSCN
jgi:ACS family D-galactonate transporter-like MFS transporter